VGVRAEAQEAPARSSANDDAGARRVENPLGVASLAGMLSAPASAWIAGFR
jgi:hypothetical protein